MDKKENTLLIRQRILDIKLVNFLFAKIENEKDINIKTITFEFNLKFNFEIEKPIVIYLTTKFFADEKKELLLGEMESEGIFEVTNIKDFVTKENEMPIPILAMFTGVLLSTSRGFYILQVKDSYLKGSMFPIIDSTQFFKAIADDVAKQQSK